MNETIIAKVEKIIYVSDSGFCIAMLDVKNEFYHITAKGIMNLSLNVEYTFEGQMKEDDKYGEYFHVYKFARPEISETEDIIDYLSSAVFEGVGKRTAGKIVKTFGKETLEIIKNNPAELRKIGISEMIIKELNQKHTTGDLLNDLYLYLNNLDFSEYMIQEIYKYYNSKEIDFPMSNLKENPYTLITHIYGYTFTLADRIYLKEKNDEQSLVRKIAAISFVINQECYKTGDTCLLKIVVKAATEKLLNYEITDFDVLIEKGVIEKKLFVFQESIQTREFYYAEKGISDNVSHRIEAIIKKLDENLITPEINKLEEQFKINYSDIQKKAIKNALMNNISIITGGPGTGKTTIIKALVTIFKDLKYDALTKQEITNKIMLCAPTGRAAQRMKEATGFESKTIHSLLGWDPYSQKFVKGVDDLLPHELIIIDEFSMVDIFLANSLLKAIRPNTIVVIVGDEAQLESVNPGNVLGDIIFNNLVPRVKLDIIFRQGEGSSIATLANQIDNNKKIELISTKDMSVLNRNGTLVDQVKQILNKSYQAGYDEMQVQVLYPKYKGANGIDNLNKVLKPIRQENIDVLVHKEREFQVGDKIMQLKNEHDKEIYNGDIGFITKIYNNHGKGKELALEIEIRKMRIDVTWTNLENLTHAYAISIHKAQGSEFSVIILPVSSESKNMLTKKLLYTAITRSKEKLIIIGDIDCFIKGIKEYDYSRKTLLKEYLVEKQKNKKSPMDFL